MGISDKDIDGVVKAYADEDKRKIAIMMINFCDKLFDEFSDFYTFTNGDDIDESLFKEMSDDIHGQDVK